MASIQRRWRGLWRCWSGRDSAPERSTGAVGHWSHRYEEGSHRPSAAAVDESSRGFPTQSSTSGGLPPEPVEAPEGPAAEEHRAFGHPVGWDGTLERIPTCSMSPRASTRAGKPAQPPRDPVKAPKRLGGSTPDPQGLKFGLRNVAYIIDHQCFLWHFGPGRRVNGPAARRNRKITR